MYATVLFKEGNLFADGRMVKNHNYLLNWIKEAIKRNDEKEIGYRILKRNTKEEGKGFPYSFKQFLSNPNLKMLICPLHYVMDGEYAFVCGFDLWNNTSTDICRCGVPNDVHGTCCGWNNAKHVCDEHLRIVDNRHPFYNKSLNDWINRPTFGIYVPELLQERRVKG